MFILLLLFCIPALAQDSGPLGQLSFRELLDQRSHQGREHDELMKSLHPESKGILDQYWRCYDPDLIEQAFPRGNPHWDGPEAEIVPKYYVALRRKRCGVEHVQWCCCAFGCCCAAGMLTYGAVKVSPYYITCGAIQGLCTLCNIWAAKKGVEQTKQFDLSVSNAGFAARPIIPVMSFDDTVPHPPSDDDHDIQEALRLSLAEQSFESGIIEPPSPAERDLLSEMRTLLHRYAQTIDPNICLQSGEASSSESFYEPLAEEDKQLLIAIRSIAARKNMEPSDHLADRDAFETEMNE